MSTNGSDKAFLMEFPAVKVSIACESSVTRLGDLLDFEQLFKAFGNNYFAQNILHSWAIFVKVTKVLIFVVKSFLGNFYRHLAIFLVTLHVTHVCKQNFGPFILIENWLSFLWREEPVLFFLNRSWDFSPICRFVDCKV